MIVMKIMMMVIMMMVSHMHGHTHTHTLNNKHHIYSRKYCPPLVKLKEDSFSFFNQWQINSLSLRGQQAIISEMTAMILNFWPHREMFCVCVTAQDNTSSNTW